QALEGFPGQVQPVETRVAPLEERDHPEALGVVVEPAVLPHRPVEGALAGMSERRMAEVMGERERLGEVLVEGQAAGDGARDLYHLEGMGQPSAEMIALVVKEDLGLVLEPPKS